MSEIPNPLFAGTSSRNLRVRLLPQKINAKNIVECQYLSIHFTSNPLTALNSALEKAVKDKSQATILVAKDVMSAYIEGSESNPTNATKYFPDLDPAQLEILLEGRDICKLQEHMPKISCKKLKYLIKDYRQFSRRLPKMIPEDYLPALKQENNPMTAQMWMS
jgi:hypothetical protein